MSNPCQRRPATEDAHNDVPDDRVILFIDEGCCQDLFRSVWQVERARGKRGEISTKLARILCPLERLEIDSKILLRLAFEVRRGNRR